MTPAGLDGAVVTKVTVPIPPVVPIVSVNPRPVVVVTEVGELCVIGTAVTVNWYVYVPSSTGLPSVRLPSVIE